MSPKMVVRMANNDHDGPPIQFKLNAIDGEFSFKLYDQQGNGIRYEKDGTVFISSSESDDE